MTDVYCTDGQKKNTSQALGIFLINVHLKPLEVFINPIEPTYNNAYFNEFYQLY